MLNIILGYKVSFFVCFTICNQGLSIQRVKNLYYMFKNCCRPVSVYCPYLQYLLVPSLQVVSNGKAPHGVGGGW